MVEGGRSRLQSMEKGMGRTWVLWWALEQRYLGFTSVYLFCLSRTYQRGFPGGSVVENLPANAGDMGSSPGLGRSHMPRSN